MEIPRYARDDKLQQGVNMRQFFKTLFFIFIFFQFQNTFATTMINVSGVAHSFITNLPVPYGDITILENGTTVKSDITGKFGPFPWPANSPLTLVFDAPGSHTTQTATMIVTNEGDAANPTFHVGIQVPDELTYYSFTGIIGAQLDPEKCHVVATITAHGKTMDDSPQGEADALSILTPDAGYTPFYFGVFPDGPLKDKTDPFIKGLTKTSVDGGVVYANLTPSAVPYMITAAKPGVAFSTSQFICRKGMFINLSPPEGPMVL